MIKIEHHFYDANQLCCQTKIDIDSENGRKATNRYDLVFRLCDMLEKGDLVGSLGQLFGSDG